MGISPSYVNLIERNQRPVSAQILLRMAEAYDLDLRDLAAGDDDRAFAELNEIFSDPLFRQIELPKQELRDLAELCPGITHALQRLYSAYVEARHGETMAASHLAGRDEPARYEANPVERVREPDRGQPQSFPDAGGCRREGARRARRARRTNCSARCPNGCANGTASWCGCCRSTSCAIPCAASTAIGGICSCPS